LPCELVNSETKPRAIAKYKLIYINISRNIGRNAKQSTAEKTGYN